MASQHRKHRGLRTQKVAAEWFAARGWPDLQLGSTAAQRLTARLTPTGSGCWEWQGAIVNGYGRIFVGSKADKTGRIERTHRLAWMLTHGLIPDGLIVCHACDNRRCCNPDHLWLGSIAANLRDMDVKGRRVNTPHSGEANGRALLTEGDVRSIRASTEPGTVLACQYGVTRSTIYSIRKGRIWKEVA